jgi:hypothetical protein
VSALSRRETAPSRYDHARRRKATRSRRMRGCYVYIPAEELAKAGYDPYGEPPLYKTWAGPRGSILLTLYRKP